MLSTSRVTAIVSTFIGCAYMGCGGSTAVAPQDGGADHASAGLGGRSQTGGMGNGGRAGQGTGGAAGQGTSCSGDRTLPKTLGLRRRERRVRRVLVDSRLSNAGL